MTELNTCLQVGVAGPNDNRNPSGNGPKDGIHHQRAFFDGQLGRFTQYPQDGQAMCALVDLEIHQSAQAIDIDLERSIKWGRQNIEYAFDRVCHSVPCLLSRSTFLL